MIEELRAQIDIARQKLADAENTGHHARAHLYSARLADLRDIAARHGIDLTDLAAHRRPQLPRPDGGDPAADASERSIHRDDVAGHR